MEEKATRIEAWRSEQEIEERVKRDNRAALREEAALRFTDRLQKREMRLQEAEERLTERQGTLAELKRAQL
eukprot:CAMPEP_0174730332 /NCGR_PEP_ID=MMETSP1094-20130205/55372_1 /TAXON_ID=156173 /ORGANISM="Chrysochromulina brevifilum, Strain UTEX LB 985" /LENGTH=70 /DNA_ID=CAMNT_0015932577 /DNA_START=12 /DNA_END=221 /DNA_ORIENTATION=+